MNLYLVERIDGWGYDEYDSHVIAAEDESAAIAFANFPVVVDKQHTCIYLGVAAALLPAGIVHSSFNAG